MNILDATRQYESWLAQRLTLIPEDLAAKHRQMAADVFSFLRATFYRWMQVWPTVCAGEAQAPQVLAVGDLHVENFGTWRDAEGRLIWGVNDFDEAHPLPYTLDLVRLAASALLATQESRLGLSADDACDSILDGYRDSLGKGGEPFVLAEEHDWLRGMAREALKNPVDFWKKLNGIATLQETIPPAVSSALGEMLPEPHLPYRVVHRTAGLGSLGRQRFVAIASWRGGLIAREAKALAASAAEWASGTADTTIYYPQLLQCPLRCSDPWIRLFGSWLVRRLAPDCSRIELTGLEGHHDECRLLRAMGRETANIHLATPQAVPAIRADLDRRPAAWLRAAAQRMADATQADWKTWKSAQ